MLRIDVDDQPVTQGSMNAIPYHRPCPKCAPGRPCGRKICVAGREIGCNVVQDGAVKVWRSTVALHARMALKRSGVVEWPMVPTGGVMMGLVFRLRRPQSHLTARGLMGAEGERNPDPWHKPDLDKLTRAILDALGKPAGRENPDPGLIYNDDAQVSRAPLEKVYAAIGKSPGVTILVGPKPRGYTYAAFGAEMDKLIAEFAPIVGTGELFPT